MSRTRHRGGQGRSGFAAAQPGVVRCAVAFGLLILCGCGTFHMVQKAPQPPKAPEAAIFIADGAGDFRNCSRSVQQAVSRDHDSTLVHTFDWSHGYGMVLADQLDFDYAQSAGHGLARQIQEFHQHAPHCRVFVLGHSAGSSVALSALEKVPPGIVERAFLIAPSVSTRYDLAPALANVKHAMHVYYSKHDWWYLGVATHVLGTQDRHFLNPAAGRVGFRTDAPDDPAFRKLKQHPWKPADTQTGHFGGHFGPYHPEFIRRNILPLTIREANDQFLDEEDKTAE